MYRLPDGGPAIASPGPGLPALPPDPARVAEGLTAIRARDPRFDEAVFLDGARTALHRAGSVGLVGSAIVGATAESAVDSVIVRFDLADDAPGHQEDWVFERPAGSQTPSGAPSITCPLCGAPAEFDANGVCPYCHAQVGGVLPIWRLTSTTRLRPLTEQDVAALAYGKRSATAPTSQAAVAPPPPALAAGLDVSSLLAIDPNFDPYDVIARARQDASDIAGARAVRDLSAVTDQFTPDMVDALTSEFKAATAGHVRHAEPFLEVGEGRIVAINVDGDRQRVTVRLHMSGERVDFDDRSGLPLTDDQTVHRWEEEWTLERRGPSTRWRVSAVALVPEPVTR